jgi:hypothetical protein
MDYSIAVEPVTDDRKSKPGETIAEARTFPPGTEQVTFGRDPTNDIVFPPESQRIVSRKHGRFYLEVSGDYAVEPFGGRYVEVDGYPAVRGQPVKDGALVRVGDKDGPVIRVRLQEVAAGAGAPDVAVTGRRKEVEPLGKRLVRMRQVQIAALAAILVVAAAVGWILTRQPDLEAELAALREAASAAAEAEFSSTEALRQAAYAVILRGRDGQESLQGTAWSYQPGLLVTNAHVAILFERLRQGETLIVRPPGGNGVDHVVTGNRLHPGYLAFRDFLAGDADALPGVAAPEDQATSSPPKRANPKLPKKFMLDALELPGDDSGWAHLGTFGSYLTKLQPDFDSRLYGYKKLSDLVRAKTDIFATEERVPEGQTQKVLYVRAKG